MNVISPAMVTPLVLIVLPVVVDANVNAPVPAVICPEFKVKFPNIVPVVLFQVPVKPVKFKLRNTLVAVVTVPVPAVTLKFIL